MTPGHRHLDGALNVALAFYIAKIDIVVLVRGEEAGQIGTRRQKRSFAAQKIKGLSQILDAVNVDLIDHGRFERVGFRHKQRTFAAAARFQRNWQDTFHSAHRTVQSEFTYEAEIFERRAIELFGHRDHPKRNRQIKAGPFFFNIGRCEIDRGAAARPKISAICNCRRHAVATLLHGGVRQPDDDDVWVAASAVDFDLNFVRIYAVNRGGINFC